MIAIVQSIYSQSVHAPVRDSGLMDNDAERYCMYVTYGVPQGDVLSSLLVKTYYTLVLRPIVIKMW